VMVQEVAYKTLLNSRRQTLHARIGEILRRDFPAIEQSQPEVLARHFTEADLHEVAVEYWLQAGRFAKERSANKEAVAHLENGLAIVNKLPEGEARTRLEISVNLALGTALIGDRGLVEPVDSVFERARALSEQVGSPNERFVATWGLWHFNNVRGAYDKAIDFANELMALAGTQQESGLVLQAHHASWTTNLVRGNISAAREHAAHGHEVYDVDSHQGHRIIYGGHDPGVCCRVFGALSLWLLGYPDQATQSIDDALRLARGLEHPMSLAQALTYGNWVSMLRRDPGPVGKNAEEAIHVATEHGITMLIGRNQIAGGWAVAQRGEWDAGIAQIREGLVACGQTGSRMGETFYMALLAETLLGAGQIDDAIVAIGQAKDAVEATDERWIEAEIYRLEGDIVLSDSPNKTDEAESSYNKALEVARSKQARLLELRAATSLARLWSEKGERNKAVDVLAPVYNWFTEGFDKADLKNAKELLDELI
jgi:predicted ATPase